MEEDFVPPSPETMAVMDRVVNAVNARPLIEKIAEAGNKHLEITKGDINSTSYLDAMKLAIDRGIMTKELLEEAWHAGRRADQLRIQIVILEALGFISPAPLPEEMN